MDVRQLEMFTAVAEEKSFTAAAERLHVSQSAVSRQLKLLEEELKTTLFIRGGRGASLTDAGQILLTAAHRITREMQDVASQISETQLLQRGVLRIGGGMTVCLFILPKLLRKFRAQYKDVDLHVTTGSTETILRLLRTRDIEIALLTLPLVEPDLEVQPVLKEEMVVITTPRHPLSRKRSVDPRALARHALIPFSKRISAWRASARGSTLRLRVSGCRGVVMTTISSFSTGCTSRSGSTSGSVRRAISMSRVRSSRRMVSVEPVVTCRSTSLYCARNFRSSFGRMKRHTVMPPPMRSTPRCSACVS